MKSCITNHVSLPTLLLRLEQRGLSHLHHRKCKRGYHNTLNATVLQISQEKYSPLLLDNISREFVAAALRLFTM